MTRKKTRNPKILWKKICEKEAEKQPLSHTLGTCLIQRLHQIE